MVGDGAREPVGRALGGLRCAAQHVRLLFYFFYFFYFLLLLLFVLLAVEKMIIFWHIEDARDNMKARVTFN